MKMVTLGAALYQNDSPVYFSVEWEIRRRADSNKSPATDKATEQATVSVSNMHTHVKVLG